jgi:O-antigen/teichoic acid export membrane protein
MLRSAGATAVLQAVSNALGFAIAVVLARLLGRGDYGTYAFVLAWASFLAIPALVGFDQFLVRGIALYQVSGEWDLLRGLLRRANQTVVATSVAIGLVGCAIAALHLTGPLRSCVYAGMALVPLTALTFLRQGTMRALGRVVAGQFPEYLVAPLVTLLLVVLLAAVRRNLLTSTTAMTAYVAGTGAAFCIGAVMLRRSLPPVLHSTNATFRTRQWVFAAFPIMLINGLWTINRYVGIIVLGMLRGTTITGVYNVVEKGAALIVLVHFAVNMPLAPAIARLHAQGDRAGVEAACEHMARVATIASLPVSLALAVFPGVYLGIFGSGFQAGAAAMTILALAQLVNAATGPASNVLIMTGNERPAMWATVAGLVVNAILGVVLVPVIGITGSAVAFASSLIVWNVSMVILGRVRVGVNVTAFRRLSTARAR